MSGVHIHTEDPINPSTAPPPPSSTSQTAPASNTAFPTAAAAAASSSSTYTPSSAQPGARPPAPTGIPSTTAQTYIPPTATPTTNLAATSTSAYSGPPAPQPGAFPVPSSTQQQTARSTSPLPPPPKAGEKVQPASYYAPQAAVPTGTSTSTSTNTAPAASGHPGGVNAYLPTAAQQGAVLQDPIRGVPPAGQTGTVSTGNQNQNQSLEHPPGYRQDPYAGDRAPFYHGDGASTDATAGTNSSSGGGAGGGLFDGGLGGGLGGGSSDEGIMSAVGNWAKGVGKKAAELESEVWKRVNK